MAMYLGEEEVGSILDLTENIEEELTEQETLLAELEEEVNGLSDKDDTALKILDGTLEEFDNTKWGLSEIKAYRFYRFGKLKRVDFTGLTEIPDYTCNECTYLENIILPNNLTKIGPYSFVFAGYNADLDFELNQENCYVSDYAFQDSKIKGIFGNYTNIGTSSFSSCLKLKNINITVNGDIEGNAFQNCYNIESFNISKESVITNFGGYVFNQTGTNRENPETKIFDWDFKNSTFTRLGSYVFAGSTTRLNKYFNIKLPKTLTKIETLTFANSDHMTLYFRSATPPTLSSNSFQNTTNLTICVPYNLVNAYKTATNWTTVADNIRGFAEENTFKQGQKLPLYSAEGYGLTWYSDIDLTQPVTTADNPENFYYCTINGEPVEVVNLNTYVDNCDLSIVDINGNSYKSGSIPVGTQLTITVTPTDNYIPYIQTFNNETFTSPLSYTTISGTDISVNAIYYDGVNAPVGETFADTEWAVIKKVIQDEQASQYWQVGDTKPLEIDVATYHVRLSDTQVGRYDYADGSRTTNAMLEFVELWNTAYPMNTTSTNLGGWAESGLRTTLNTTILEQFPAELRSLFEEVVVASANGGSSNYTAITTSSNKLFIPCAYEIGHTGSAGREGEGTTWDYYFNEDKSKRIKVKENYISGYNWWTRSPYTTNTQTFSVTNSNGDVTTGQAVSNSILVSPCWAW